jgi:Fe-S-cluster-containing dehydrogenase component
MLIRKAAYIKHKDCLNCRPCPAREACPAGSFREDDEGRLYIDGTCSGCRICSRACLNRAIEVN